MYTHSYQQWHTWKQAHTHSRLADTNTHSGTWTWKNVKSSRLTRAADTSSSININKESGWRRQRKSTWMQAVWQRMQLLLGYACLLPPPHPLSYYPTSFPANYNWFIMDQVAYQVPGEITMGVRRLWGERGVLGTGYVVVNVEQQNQLALIGKRFILPERT